MICEPIKTNQLPSLFCCSHFVSFSSFCGLRFYPYLKCYFLHVDGNFEPTFPISLEEVSGAPVLRRGEAWAEFRRLLRIEKAKSLRSRHLANGRTLYKRKGKKIQPADVGYENGEKPGGDVEWRQQGIEKEVYQAGSRFAE